jgi:hypothetical protein
MSPAEALWAGSAACPNTCWRCTPCRCPDTACPAPLAGRSCMVLRCAAARPSCGVGEDLRTGRRRRGSGRPGPIRPVDLGRIEQLLVGYGLDGIAAQPGHSANDGRSVVPRWARGTIETVHRLLIGARGSARSASQTPCQERPRRGSIASSRSAAVAGATSRDDHLAQLERWIGHTVAAGPEYKQLLHRYARSGTCSAGSVAARQRSQPPTTRPSPPATGSTSPRGSWTGSPTTTSPWPPAGTMISTSGWSTPASTSTARPFQLATELPAAVLARMLGIHIKVAVAWQHHVSTGNWMAYAADVSRRSTSAES